MKKLSIFILVVFVSVIHTSVYAQVTTTVIFVGDCPPFFDDCGGGWCCPERFSCKTSLGPNCTNILTSSTTTTDDASTTTTITTTTTSLEDGLVLKEGDVFNYVIPEYTQEDFPDMFYIPDMFYVRIAFYQTDSRSFDFIINDGGV